MAAATGYDGPNDEQLHAYADLRYADLPFYGSNLAEVFAVRVPDAAASSQGKRLPPCGMVCIAGAYSSQSAVVFARSRHDDPVTPQLCDWQGNLVLTGPARAISADGLVGFRIHLDDNSQDSSIEETWKKSVLLYREDPTFDRPLLDIANTPYGPMPS